MTGRFRTPAPPSPSASAARTSRLAVGAAAVALGVAALALDAALRGGGEEEVADINAFFDGMQGAGGLRGDQEKDGAVRGDPPRALLATSDASAHACTLAAAPDGALLLAYFYGDEQEGGDGIGIVFSRLARGANKWTEPKTVSVEAGRSAQNPVLLADHDAGKLTLFHTTTARRGVRRSRRCCPTTTRASRRWRWRAGPS